MFAIYQGEGPETPDCLSLSSCALAMPLQAEAGRRGWMLKPQNCL